MYVATKNTLDETEESIRSLLMQVHQSNMSVPMAPELRSFLHSTKYSVGEYVDESEFGSFDIVFGKINQVKQMQPLLLNYEAINVDNALREWDMTTTTSIGYMQVSHL